MRFGARIEAGGGVRFRLWAPGARTVELCLIDQGGSEADSLRMPPVGGGWYEIHARSAGNGTRYRYRIDEALSVPDPASRFQPRDIEGPSEVIDPASFVWPAEPWSGRPWHEVVIYELHAGTFSPEGSFAGIEAKLDHLMALGINTIELMPIADFPGRRNWGYDGVLLFAPDSRYGRPEDLKRLVAAAHARGIGVLLDVVYNHFGPQGNYLAHYAPSFFSVEHHTPWGAAINFDAADAATVREFYIQNALYWLEEFQLDGLRLDAVHAIVDDSQPDILIELAERVRHGPGRERHIHLVLENDHNASHYLQRFPDGSARWYDAQWNDDFHHALHVALTGETDGYYCDYADRPSWYLGRCLSEGFAYQGESSDFRAGAPRGEPSRDLPITAFVSFLQNHDQVGNRAFGERIDQLACDAAVRAAVVLRLLAPSPPLLFMGEEFSAHTPFLFFCDFDAALADAVREGRRAEFAHFARFADPALRAAIPDPGAPATFQSSKLDWDACENPGAADRLQLYARLLRLRREVIMPRLEPPGAIRSRFAAIDRGLQVEWTLADASRLTLIANLSVSSLNWDRTLPSVSNLLYAEPADFHTSVLTSECLPPWSAAVFLESPPA